VRKRGGAELTPAGRRFLQHARPPSSPDSGRLFRVGTRPEFAHPAYRVFPRQAPGEMLQQAIASLRAAATHITV
jgi:hypothetical protein